MPDPTEDKNKPLGFDLGNVPEFELDDENIAGYEEVTDETIRLDQQALWDGRVKNQQDQLDLEYGVKDDYGNFVLDEYGDIERRPLSSFEKIDNSFQNFAQRLYTFDDKLVISSNEVARKVFGDNAVDEFIEDPETSDFWKNGLSEAEFYDAQREIELANSGSGETGSIIDGVSNGDPLELAAGIVNAATSIIPSLIIGTATGGASTAVEFFSDSYLGYNGAVAEREDTTLSELRASDKDSFAIPAAFAAITTASELVGFKGTKEALLNRVKATGQKRLANLFLTGNKEGLTEFFQTGIENAQQTLGETGSAVDAGGAFIKTLASKEGWESYLQGFVGGSGFNGGDAKNLRNAASALRAPNDHVAAEKAISRKVQLNQLLNNTKDPELIKNYKKQIKQLDAVIDGAVIRANGIVNKLTDKQLSEVVSKSEAVEALRRDNANLNTKYENGEITSEQKNEAVKGIAADYKAALTRLSEIKSAAEQQPTVRDKDGTPNERAVTEETKKVADNINKVTDGIPKGDKVSDDIFHNTVVPNTVAAIHKVVNRLYKTHAGFEEQSYSKEDFVTDLTYGTDRNPASSLHGLVKSFRPGEGQKLTTYITKNLGSRGIRILEERGIYGEGGKVEITEEGSDKGKLGIVSQEDTDINNDPKISSVPRISVRLGLDPALGSKIENQAKLAVQKSKPVTTKDFEKGITQHFKDALYAPLRAKLKEAGYIENNWETLFDQVPKASWASAKKGTIAHEWATRKPSKAEFLSYYNAKGESRSAKSNRLERLAQGLAERLGAEAAKAQLANDPELQERFNLLQDADSQEGSRKASGFDKALDLIDIAIHKLSKIANDGSINVGGIAAPLNIVIGGLRATKLALQGGQALSSALVAGYEAVKASDVLEADWYKFVKNKLNQYTIDSATLQEGLEAGDLESESVEATWSKLGGGKVSKLLGRPSKAWQNNQEKIDEKFDNNAKFFEKNKDLYVKYLPKGFWNMLSTLKKDGTQNKASLLRKEDAKAFADKAPDTGTKWDNDDAFGRISRANTPAKVKEIADDPKYKQEVKDNQQALFEFGDAIQALSKAGVPTSELAALVKSFSNTGIGTSNIFRKAPSLMGYSGNISPKIRLVPEHNPPAGFIGMTMFEHAIKGQWNDGIKNAITEKFGYWQIDHAQDPSGKFTGDATKNFNIIKDDPAARYWAAGVSVIDTFFLDGKSVAEASGIDAEMIKAAKSAPDLAEAIQEAVVDKTTPDFVERGLDYAIEGIEKFTGTGLQTNLAAVPLHILSGGLRATKLAYKGGKGLAKAIKKGYEVVKDFMSEQDWNEFANKTISEVTDVKGNPLGVAVAADKIIQKEKNRQEKLNIAKAAGLDLDPKSSTHAINKAIREHAQSLKNPKESPDQARIEKIIHKKKRGIVSRILNKIILPPSAEDFKGLLYTLASSESDLTFLKEKLIDPYMKGVEKFKANKRAAEGILEKAVKKLGSKNLKNANQSILDAIASGELDGLTTNERRFVESLKEIDGGKFFDSIDQHGLPIPSQLFKYNNGKARKVFLNEFLTNSNAFFKDSNGKIKKSISDKYGESYAASLADMLTRMETGRNRQAFGAVDKEAQTFTNFINQSNAVIMFFNSRSAILQMLSAANYLRPSLAIANPLKLMKHYPGDVATILNSEYLKARFGGLGFEVTAEELVSEGQGGVMNKISKIGFLPTKVMDSLAIATGGALYYRAMLEKHGDPEIAMQKFIEFTEENQQSADPSKISKIQAGPLGRVVFAFGNTPFQYMRVVKRSAQDLKAGRGSAPDNLAKMSYYGVIQGVMFTGLQQALWKLLDDEEEEEEEGKEKVVFALESIINSNLRALGLPGAVTAALASTSYELYKQSTGASRVDKFNLVKKAISISPPLSRKISSVSELAEINWKQNKQEFLEDGIQSRAAWEFLANTGDVVNLPTKRLLQKYDNLKDLTNEEIESIDKLAKIGGYSNYNLGIPDAGDEDEGLGGGLGGGGLGGSPLEREQTGAANRDGTIEVDPDLSPEEKHKTIQHEKQHVKDMEENGLDYDDDAVYYKDSVFQRKDGRVKMGNKWVREGHPELPWEKKAYNAETPLAREKDPKQQATDEKYIGNDQNIAQVDQSRERFEEFYSDPKTQELYKENTGDDDLDDRVGKALDTKIQSGRVPGQGKASYDKAIGEYGGEITVADFTDPAVVDHELSHAAGFDYKLGKKAQEILGKPKSGDKYLSDPSETYGNLHEFRTRLDLRGFERNLTTKKIKELIKFNDLEKDPDLNQMIEEFGIENITEALNKVASNSPKKKKSLKDLYSNQVQNSYNA